jgi:hypothetical protein
VYNKNKMEKNVTTINVVENNGRKFR